MWYKDANYFSVGHSESRDPRHQRLALRFLWLAILRHHRPKYDYPSFASHAITSTDPLLHRSATGGNQAFLVPLAAVAAVSPRFLMDSITVTGGNWVSTSSVEVTMYDYTDYTKVYASVNYVPYGDFRDGCWCVLF